VHHQGQLQAALSLYQRALAIQEKVSGPHHPTSTETSQRLRAVVVAVESSPAVGYPLADPAGRTEEQRSRLLSKGMPRRRVNAESPGLRTPGAATALNGAHRRLRELPAVRCSRQHGNSMPLRLKFPPPFWPFATILWQNMQCLPHFGPENTRKTAFNPSLVSMLVVHMLKNGVPGGVYFQRSPEM
jgi:hypothetical protein